MQSTIRPRRLFVSGGSRMSANAAGLWRELGRLLAMDDGLVVITGGLASLVDDPDALTADRMIVDGMLPVLHSRGVSTEGHIETMLPDASQDLNEMVRFRVGRIRVLQRRNPQSRRFSMVHSADVVLSVEGMHGTRSVLDVALAIDRPVLPLPFGGGASGDVWRAQREDIVNWFRIDAKEAEDFEQTRLAELGEWQVRELAGRVHACLMRGFTQGCFVIMSFGSVSDPVFDEAIRPALGAQGFQPWRTDRSVPTGDIIAAIRDGITHCLFAIADTTDDRPNVMYELGFAHAINKPVILLRRSNPDGSPSPAPFDFQTQSILYYGDDLDELRRRLEAVIGMIGGRIRTMTEV
jgi:hypothetical protein